MDGERPDLDDEEPSPAQLARMREINDEAGRMSAAGADMETILAYLARELTEVIGFEVTPDIIKQSLQHNMLSMGQPDPVRVRRHPEENTIGGVCISIGKTLLSFAKVSCNKAAITVIPSVISFMKPCYISCDGRSRTLAEVLEITGSDSHMIGAIVMRKVQRIRDNRITVHPKFLLPDDDMEYLRMVVYLFEQLGFSNEIFCDLGRDIIAHLRAYVHEYEKRFEANRS